MPDAKPFTDESLNPSQTYLPQKYSSQGYMNRIKFGIQNGLNVARAGYTEDQILTACILADKTGYDSIFYMDHTNVPQWKKAIVLDPWVMLSAIAAITNNVEIGTCVTDAIRRHPSNIALAAITLDRVSKGRAILGIGAGEAQNLKEFCIPFEKPVSKWEEQIEVIKALYSSSPDNTVDYSGKYYDLKGACLQAPPIRKPHPPTYMASGGKRTLMLTGKLGDGWLPIGYTPELFEDHRGQIVDSMKKHDRTEEEKENFQMALDIDVYFSEDAEESWARMKEAVKVSLFKPEVLRVHNLKEIEGFDFVKYFTEYSMSNQEWIVKMREAATRIPDGVARSSTAIGTPDDVIPTFERFLKAGVNHFVIRFWGKDYFGSIDKFATHVMPHLREQK
ncbi:flavin-dependent oxidoreductase [Cenarchaeum symbiosum A]|uniref:Flavin-dependent oxidoreductase n=1 Tax=Cenarchaeum symbiosum (strain A) TaxID=414004 RepID=A0RV14_CENSY|nr:flavin-dependent oxidoreductase [Cenarchaeum symbiosum A]